MLHFIVIAAFILHDLAHASGFMASWVLSTGVPCTVEQGTSSGYCGSSPRFPRWVRASDLQRSNHGGRPGLWCKPLCR
jgi:hypothetical protein